MWYIDSFNYVIEFGCYAIHTQMRMFLKWRWDWIQLTIGNTSRSYRRSVNTHDNECISWELYEKGEFFITLLRYSVLSISENCLSEKFSVSDIKTRCLKKYQNPETRMCHWKYPKVNILDVFGICLRRFLSIVTRERKQLDMSFHSLNPELSNWSNY